MNSPVPSEPVFFMKPDTAILRDGQPFFIPDFSKEVHHEIEIVLKVSKHGKNISEKFAHKYYDQIGIGVDFTARDLPAECKSKGLPWEKAKAFDGSAPVGDFFPKEQLGNEIGFHLEINGKTVQKGNTKDLIFSFDAVIAYVSKFVTLKTGDLNLTGTPEGVGPVKAGDELTGYISERKAISFMVR